MKKIFTVILCVLTKAGLCGYMPHSFSIESSHFNDRELMAAIEANSSVKTREGAEGLFLIPHGVISSEGRQVEVNAKLLKDLESLEDAMGLLKHDEFLAEILFIRKMLGKYKTESDIDGDDWKLEQVKFLRPIYSDIAKSFVDYAQTENPVLLKNFANRTKNILKRNGITIQGDTKSYIAEFYETAYHQMFNKSVAHVSYPISFAGQKQIDHMDKLSNFYNKNVQILETHSLQVEPIASLEGSIYSHFDINKDLLTVSLNYRGFKELDHAKKIILPIKITMPLPMKRDFVFSLNCIFSNVDEEVFSKQEVQTDSDRKNYNKVFKQSISRRFLQSDACNINYQNLDLQKDQDLLASLLAEQLNIDQLKKTGKINFNAKFDLGDDFHYLIKTNMKVEL